LFVNIKMRFFPVSVVLVLFSVHYATSFVSPLFAGKAVAKKTVKAKVTGKPAKGGKKAAPAKGGKKAAYAPAKGKKKASPTPAKVVKKVKKKAPPKAKIVKAPASNPAPSGPSASLPVVLASNAMSSLKPLFAFETKVQAGVASFVGEVVGVPFRVDRKGVRKELKERTSSSKPVMYTYGLSPFSSEAINIIEDYEVDVIELGPEWFLLGPNGSEKRLVLSELSQDAQTSLPHLFLKGESLGGLSTGGRDNTGINGLLESGRINTLLKRRRTSSRSKK